MGLQRLLHGIWRATLTPRKVTRFLREDHNPPPALAELVGQGESESGHTGAEGRFGHPVDGDTG